MVTTQNSIIIPIYNNEEFVTELLKCCEFLNENLLGKSEFIFVVDGSPDSSLEKFKISLPHAKIRSKLIVHSRNFGSFSAIRTGMQHTKSDHLFFMAADLQEPPSFILEASKILKEEKHDIVIGKRVSRDDGFLNDLSSNVFWTLYRKIVPAVPKGGVDIFACNNKVKETLLTLNESNSSLIGQLFWIGFKRVELEYSRVPRQYGKSGWTLGKKIKYLKDSIFNFTDYPLKLLLGFGFIGCAISIILGFTLVFLRFTGDIAVPGYVAIMTAIMFFGSLNLLGLGILGEYLHRTYENTKQRATSIVTEIIQYEK